ncbi:protein MCM10 homolog isoform X2 [Homarus americanus]|uniref:protein MCM10 homolog isoform X2 n=1 Tax=Homarus americanus TaxID=6706 RepID=UPI001C47083A|nr:protein MCM10 homolog isoform X2 [Homarus americanus]
MADSETEYDLDSLAAMLDDDDDRGWTGAESEDLHTLTTMLDAEHEEKLEEPESSAPKVPDVTNPSMADLGLVLSDDEDQPTTCVSAKSDFSAAFKDSKFSKKREEETLANNSNTDFDPLEAELQQMEERMNLLRDQLSKKKKFNVKDGSTSTKFTKLTNISHEAKRTVRTLSADEESNLHRNLKRKSELHRGDTDSEDEEDNRNPFEQRYNSCGREIRKRISHESNEVQNNRKDEVLARVKGKSQQKLGWKGVDGSLVSLKEAGTSSSEVDKNVTVDQYSGIRIINPVVSGDSMRERMEGRKMVRMSTINLHLRGGDIEGDWVTIGVLVSKSDPKTSQKGSQYSIWKLSDLTDCTKTVAVFLFSGAHKGLWKSSVGTVVGLLNPQIMKDRQGEKNTDLLTLSISDHHKAMVMGSSKDLGWCKGRTKQNSQCKYFVNKSSCEFCLYHIQREYQKTSAKRADIQSSFTRVDPRRRLQEKVLGKDQVFYGGQLYSSPTPGSAPKQVRANKGKDLATLNSLKLKLKAEQLKEEDKQKSFTLKHMSDGEINAVKQVAQSNDSFSEKLLAPTPGARNLLRHLVKEDTDKKIDAGEFCSVSAKDLLNMTYHQIQSRKRQQEQSMSQTPLSLSPGSGQSRRSFSPSATPKLGRGIQPGGDIDLDISPPPSRPGPAKAHAMALLQGKGGIQAKDPNAVKNTKKASDPQFQEKIRKRLSNSSMSDNENQVNKKSRLAEAILADSHKSKLGSIDVNSDKFKAMMEQKSRHTNLINVVENEALEKYYQGLEKKEMLEDKMLSVMEIPTTAYVCLQCKYMTESASDFCREENHPLKTVKAKKRFFECRNCKRRTSSLDKLPRKSCSNCDHNSWQRVAMGKAKNGPKLDSEILSLRGDELKHYSGSSNQVFLHV